jgi:hypothetical protein
MTNESENPKLVVEPGAGRTSKLAKVVYQFNRLVTSASTTQRGGRYGIASFANSRKTTSTAGQRSSMSTMRRSTSRRTRQSASSGSSKAYFSTNIRTLIG